MSAGRSLRRIALLGPLLLLGGCLEVPQYPPYENGAYAGKKDNLQFQRGFGNDPEKWNAAIAQRVRGQNEYLRSKP